MLAQRALFVANLVKQSFSGKCVTKLEFGNEPKLHGACSVNPWLNRFTKPTLPFVKTRELCYKPGNILDIVLLNIFNTICRGD